MAIDTINLLFGSGFAVFIALLAWGNQIRGPRKEVMQLEEAFRKEFSINKSTSNALIKESFDKKKSAKFTFLQQTKAVLDVFDNPDVGDKDYSLFKQFQKLHGIRKQLEKDYKFRYLASVWLCIALFIATILVYFLSAFIYIENIIILLIFLHIGIIIYNFFRTYKGENIFIDEISKINDNIEVKK